MTKAGLHLSHDPRRGLRPSAPTIRRGSRGSMPGMLSWPQLRTVPSSLYSMASSASLSVRPLVPNCNRHGAHTQHAVPHVLAQPQP